MQKMTAKVDRQTTSLLDFTFWSNVVVILLVVVINTINFIRISKGLTAFVTAAAPEMLLMISFALALYLGYGCLTALAIKKRLRAVYITLDDAGVSGLSLSNPTSNAAGEPFALSYGEICSISVVDIPVTKKHVAPSLKMETAEHAFIVPAPEKLKELVQLIADHMTAK